MSNTLVKQTLSSASSWSPLMLRIPAGIIFMAHGAQKLFGWFGGHGLEGTGKWMASIGLEPGFLMALMAGGAEFFGGLFILVGLLTRPTALVLAVTMVVAIVTVHLDNGLFMSNGGYEFGLALLAMSISLAVSGAGKLGLDNLLLQKRHQQGSAAII
ncbi:DoxX family protein [Photobacterium makurazakiensis]|uniref:DoxX family protein n=1 Tax=Photobacterium makurazakiensis TaxID=2910234 RepID=UPI003D141FCA